MDFETRAFKYQDSINRGGKGDHVTIKDPPAESRTRSKKDTNKWCKGVVGREHKTVYIYLELFWSHTGGRQKLVEPPMEMEGTNMGYRDFALPWVVLYCTVCQKQIRLHENSFDLRRKGIIILTEFPPLE